MGIKIADISTLTNGLFLDSEVCDQPKGTYPYALNAIDGEVNATTQGLYNEQSHELVAEQAGIIGHTHIAERNQTLIFTKQGEIKLFDHQSNELKFVCSDKEFGCDWGFDTCEHMYAEIKNSNHCTEMYIYFSSGCVYYRVNIDEMLDRVRKESIKACEDCSYFQVFNCVCAPKISATPVEFTGSAFEGGAVSFSVQLEDDDGSKTNWFEISNTVYLGTEHNVPGEPALKGARVQLSDLDTNYTKINLAVLKTVSNTTTVEQLPSMSISGRDMTFMYYGQKGTLINIATIVTKNKAFLRGQDLLQKDGRMFYYNLKNERNLNVQKYANNVRIEVMEFETTMAQNLKYNYPTLLRGEVYAIGIVYKFCDGTYSPVGHIPCPLTNTQSANSSPEGIQASILRSAAQNSNGTSGAGSYTNNGAIPSYSATTNQNQQGGSGVGDVGYVPYTTGSCNTANQHQRYRNPQDWQDRPQENDKQEESVNTDISNVSTFEGDVAQAGACHDTHYSDCNNAPEINMSCGCCDEDEITTNPQPDPVEPDPVGNSQVELPKDLNATTLDDGDCCNVSINQGQDCNNCTEAQEALTEDLPDYSNTEQNLAENLAGFGRDFQDPNVNVTGSIKSSAQYLYETAIKNREYEREVRPTFTHSNGQPNATGTEPTDNQPKGAQGEQTNDFNPTGNGDNDNIIGRPVDGDSLRGDPWTDNYGNNLTEEPPRVTNVYAPKCWTSTLDYPDTKNCAGQRFYPEGKISHHEMPTCAEAPHYVSYQNGVVSKFTPENYEYGNTYVRLLGLRASNVVLPPDDELPKPLCPESPFKLVYVKRTDANRSVLAKGWVNGMFTGEANGTTYNYPRHGVNSFEHVDRFISAGGDGTSRMGAQSNAPNYNFHSPDTDADNSFLPVTHVRPELELKGNGWLHGLYAKGKEPEDQWYGTRIDQRGARVSNNLNHYVPSTGADIEVPGITYAPANTVVEPPQGIGLPLMNRYREKSIYFSASSNLPGDQVDESFNGGVLDHFGPTVCTAPYVALVRQIPDQYGSVENAKYSDLNIMANRSHASGISVLYGLCGDNFIVPYSKKRTSYVSNKVGDIYNVPAKPGSPCRARNICSSPDDKIFEYTGVNHYSTKLPKSGDLYDPKNYAGLHTVGGGCGADGLSKNFAASSAAGTSESDYYYPRTLNSLVCTIVESRVNAWMLETGVVEQNELVYPHLKTRTLDSSAPDEHHWEDSYLNQFHCEVEQPSKAQLAKKAAIRTFLTVILPALGLVRMDNWDSIVDTTAGMMTYPLLAAFWLLLKNVLYTNNRVDELLGIKRCRTDSEGGDLDDIIKGWSDFYCKYNWDYSKKNDEQLHYAFPSNYNDCDCDDCDKGDCVGQGRQLIQEIYHSSKQQLDSEIDAYRNVYLGQYNELPAHAGHLRKLFIQGGNMYAHTSEGLWAVQMSQSPFPTDIGSQLTGAGQLILNPVQMGAGSREGLGGTNYPNAAINVGGWGYFFVDDIAKKLYRFNGTLDEISNKGAYHFFKEWLPFCKDKDDCFDEKSAGGQSHVLGWDPRHNRLLYTKRDISDADSFTLSYTPKAANNGKFISFHSWLPYDYFWDRDNTYAIDKTGIYKFHKSDAWGDYLGDKGEFIVDMVARKDNYACFKLSYFELLTRASNGLRTGLPDTFETISLNGEMQGTGELPTKLELNWEGKRTSQFEKSQSNPGVVTLIKDCNVWRAKGLNDLTTLECKNDFSELWEQPNECHPFIQPLGSAFDCTNVNRQNMKNRGFRESYLRYRLKYTKQDNKLNVLLLRTYEEEYETDIS